MSKAIERDSFFKAGMYLLDSFTAGMYNDPLTIYREYIQNAVDSIDAVQNGAAGELEVRIQLDPAARRITILDNAIGISASDAEVVLCTIGNSNKAESQLRGFRGIGRLGGIAFSDKAIFRTKAKNEALESIQVWDCKSLRDLLSEHRRQSFTLEEVFRRVTTFRQEKCTQVRESYFEVTLEGVTSFRNQLFDIQKVRRYLAQVAPLPLNPLEFSCASLIDEYLSSRLSSYGKYAVFLNGEMLFKPYRDRVKVTKKGEADRIDGIEFFEVKNGNEHPLAFGWYGKRKTLLGSIARGDDSAGIRVRVGNIQIGDAHLLDFCFREPRFNSYVPGEIYVEGADLIPNSRRDDFVDNLTKGFFYNAIERQVGVPVSKEIRLRSRLASTGCNVAVTQEEREPSDNHPEQQPQNCQPSCVTPPNEEGLGVIKKEAECVAKHDPCQTACFSGTASAFISPEGVLQMIKRCCNTCPNASELIELIRQVKC